MPRCLGPSSRLPVPQPLAPAKPMLLAPLLGMLLALAGCGGGGGDSAATPAGSGNDPPPAVSSSFVPVADAQQCDPANPLAPAGQRSGSLAQEKRWLAAFMASTYLWNDQIPGTRAADARFSLPLSQVTPDGVPQALDNYFEALKTPQRTASGARVDRFSFTYGTSAWAALSSTGTSLGYGAQLVLAQPDPPRRAVVASVEPGSPAALAGLVRGTEIVVADGVDLIRETSDAGIATLNAALNPSASGVHSFTVQDPDGTNRRTLSLVAQTVTETPVRNVQVLATATGDVGYLQFDSHIASAEPLLIAAIRRLQGVSDLVLDLRYNGGGYLFMASQLAYMVAGPGPTTDSSGASRSFQRLQYNSRWRSLDSSTPFYNQSCVLDASGRCSSTAALPTLGLSRVFVLTQNSTCSASEAIINGLRGVGVTVHTIGGTTCGKPYGFVPQDNCGVSYFAIQFQGRNAQGSGDYGDGLAPTCAVDDDYAHALGDRAERQLATALGLRDTGACQLASPSAVPRAGHRSGPAVPSRLLRHPLRDSSWLLPG
ncbi:MAG: peptidase S41 [Burkholderiales bacterium PBB5]|nr:MAG: peptidase S41 [Burkholderiales bacterium PBB5]